MLISRISSILTFSEFQQKFFETEIFTKIDEQILKGSLFKNIYANPFTQINNCNCETLT